MKLKEEVAGPTIIMKQMCMIQIRSKILFHILFLLKKYTEEFGRWITFFEVTIFHTLMGNLGTLHISFIRVHLSILVLIQDSGIDIAK